jgi:hypothetical protein
MGNMNESMIVASGSVQPNAPAVITSDEFATMLLEVQEQPAWRRNADVEADYYDGNQLDADTLMAMKDLGMAPIIENLTAPTIDAVLGLEAKTRLDWKIAAGGDEKFAEVAEAMNYKMKESETETHADRACSDAFGAQVKAGLGWVEVARDHDPFRYPYRVEYVHRNEVFWDFRGKRPDTTDWRYLLRKRWYDTDVLALVFQDKAELLKASVHGWTGFDPTMLIDGGRSTGLAMDFTRERGWTIEEQEWRDTYRKRLCLSEVWYRRWIRGHVLKAPDGRVIEFDRTNSAHVEAVAYNLVQVRSAVFSKVRLAWFVGPHKLADMPSPYKHDKFPYVPFFGKREDMTGIPYGLIRAMKPLQDEVNARNTKMIWLLAAKRVTMTQGVTKDSPEVVRQEAARPNALHVLDPQKMQQGGIFKVETDFQLNAQQYNVLQDKRQAIKNVAGVYASFEGNQKGNISGIAANTLVEQSTQTLAEIMDNFQFARRQVGELLMSLIIEDIGEDEIVVNIENEINGSKQIKLNTQKQVEGGEVMLTNSVQQAKLRVALSDVPSTASYRSQRLMMLTEITKSLPPNLQGMVLDFVMAATDLPERAEIVKRIRKALNLGEMEPPKTPEEAQAMQQMQAEQQQAAAIQQRAVELDLNDKDAKVQKTLAEADKIRAEAQQLAMNVESSRAQMEASGSPREQELHSQLQAIVQQAQEAQQAMQQQIAQSQQEHEAELAEMRDALANAQMAADNKRAEADNAVRIAEIDREARIAEADAEVRKAEIEAGARQKEEAIDQRFGEQFKALMDQVSGIKAEIGKAKESGKAEKAEHAMPNLTIPVHIVVEKGSGNKTGTMQKQADGSFKMEVKEEGGK